MWKFHPLSTAQSVSHASAGGTEVPEAARGLEPHRMLPLAPLCSTRQQDQTEQRNVTPAMTSIK